MKRTWSWLIVGLIAGQAWAQQGGVFLEVKRLANEKDKSSNYESHWGSYDRDYSRSLRLGITVRAMGGAARPLRIEWYFVAKDLRSGARWIFDSGRQEATLDPKLPLKLEKESKQIQSNVQSYSGMTRKIKSGDEIDGYLVRVLENDKLVATMASSRPLDAVARDEAKLQAMLDSRQN